MHLKGLLTPKAVGRVADSLMLWVVILVTVALLSVIVYLVFKAVAKCRQEGHCPLEPLWLVLRELYESSKSGIVFACYLVFIYAVGFYVRGGDIMRF